MKIEREHFDNPPLDVVEKKKECSKAIDTITDFINENCDIEDVYKLHRLENHIYYLDQFINGV